MTHPLDGVAELPDNLDPFAVLLNEVPHKTERFMAAFYKIRATRAQPLPADHSPDAVFYFDLEDAIARVQQFNWSGDDGNVSLNSEMETVIAAAQRYLDWQNHQNIQTAETLPADRAAALDDMHLMHWYGAHLSDISAMSANEFLHKHWDTIKAALMQGGVAVPDGWKLVPIDCTDDIAEVIAMEAKCCGGIAETIWRRAIAAAPQPPREGDHE